MCSSHTSSSGGGVCSVGEDPQSADFPFRVIDWCARALAKGKLPLGARARLFSAYFHFQFAADYYPSTCVRAILFSWAPLGVLLASERRRN
jgi:hypothetical protein